LIGKLGRLLKWIILLPILVAVVLIAVANDQTVTVHFNPFDTSDQVLRIDAALYQVAFAVFVLGVVFGGLLTWLGRLRRRGRTPPRQAEAGWAPNDDAPRRADRSTTPAPAAAYLPRPERG
jgi:hypothetical protein